MASRDGLSGEGHEYMFTANNGNLHQGNNYYLDGTPKAIDCQEELFIHDPYIDRDTLRNNKERTSGTCEWIKENARYKRWLNGDGQCLWIRGGEGTGKTVLSVFLTEDLEKNSPQNATTLYFFCIKGDKDRSNANSVLRGLSYELLHQKPKLSASVSRYFKTEKRTKDTLSSVDNLWSMFKTLLTAPDLGTVFCVLDGLDACDDESIQKLTGWFHALYSSSTKQQFNLAIVSRNVRGLDKFPQILLDSANSDYKMDVERFVSFKIQQWSSLPDYNNHFQEEIKDTLLRQSKENFLWIASAMVKLLDKSTCEEVTDTLKDLSQELPKSWPVGLSLKTIDSNMWYWLETPSLTQYCIQLVDDSTRRADDVQIGLAVEAQPESDAWPKQLWSFRPNPNDPRYWAISTRFLGNGMSLDVYGNDRTHPRLATTAHVSGQMWELIDRGKGCISLWNTFSGRERYLGIHTNYAGSKRLTMSLGDGDDESQVWRLHPVKAIV